MHTLGANPAAPIELLGSNPSALRRRLAVDEVAPGGVVEIRSHPDRPGLIELGSPSVDLVLATSPALDEHHAETLASRVGYGGPSVGRRNASTVNTSIASHRCPW